MTRPSDNAFLLKALMKRLRPPVTLLYSIQLLKSEWTPETAPCNVKEQHSVQLGMSTKEFQFTQSSFIVLKHKYLLSGFADKNIFSR